MTSMLLVLIVFVAPLAVVAGIYAGIRGVAWLLLAVGGAGLAHSAVAAGFDIVGRPLAYDLAHPWIVVGTSLISIVMSFAGAVLLVAVRLARR